MFAPGRGRQRTSVNASSSPDGSLAATSPRPARACSSKASTADTGASPTSSTTKPERPTPTPSTWPSPSTASTPTYPPPPTPSRSPSSTRSLHAPERPRRPGSSYFGRPAPEGADAGAAAVKTRERGTRGNAPTSTAYLRRTLWDTHAVRPRGERGGAYQTPSPLGRPGNKLDHQWTIDVPTHAPPSMHNVVVCGAFGRVSDGTRTRGRRDHKPRAEEADPDSTFAGLLPMPNQPARWRLDRISDVSRECDLAESCPTCGATAAQRRTQAPVGEEERTGELRSRRGPAAKEVVQRPVRVGPLLLIGGGSEHGRGGLFGNPGQRAVAPRTAELLRTVPKRHTDRLGARHFPRALARSPSTAACPSNPGVSTSSNATGCGSPFRAATSRRWASMFGRRGRPLAPDRSLPAGEHARPACSPRVHTDRTPTGTWGTRLGNIGSQRP